MINSKFNSSPALLEEIKKVLKTVNYGSVEIYVQNSKVTQLTVRKIVKAKYDINEEDAQDKEQTISLKTIQITQTPSHLAKNQAQLGKNRVLTKEN